MASNVLGVIQEPLFPRLPEGNARAEQQLYRRQEYTVAIYFLLCCAEEGGIFVVVAVGPQGGAVPGWFQRDGQGLLGYIHSNATDFEGQNDMTWAPHPHQYI